MINLVRVAGGKDLNVMSEGDRESGMYANQAYS